MKEKPMFVPVEISVEDVAKGIALSRQARDSESLSEAKELYRQAWKTNPNDLGSFMAYQELSVSSKNKLLEIFLEKEKAYWNYYVSKGDVRRDKGTFAVIGEHYDYMQLLGKILRLLVFKHRDDEAITYAKKMIRLDNLDLAHAQDILASMYLKYRRFDEFDILMRHYDHSPTFKYAFHLIGAKLRRLKKVANRWMEKLAQQNKALYFFFAGFGEDWNYLFAKPQEKRGSYREASYWLNSCFHPIINQGPSRIRLPLYSDMPMINVFDDGFSMVSFLVLLALDEFRQNNQINDPRGPASLQHIPVTEEDLLQVCEGNPELTKMGVEINQESIGRVMACLKENDFLEEWPYGLDVTFYFYFVAHLLAAMGDVFEAEKGGIPQA